MNKTKNCCFPSEFTSRWSGIFLVLFVVLGFAGCGSDETLSLPNSVEPPPAPVEPPPASVEPPPASVEPPPAPVEPPPAPDPCSVIDEPWQQDVFCPSENFYQYCADLSEAFSQDAMQGTYVDENNWLRSWSHETYLWYDEIEDADPACCTTPEYFQLMKTKEEISPGKPKDRFHFSQSTRKYQQFSSNGITAGYGATLRYIRTRPPREIVVIRTEPGSPATTTDVNLLRGTRILGVDGIDIVNSNNSTDIDRINAALRPSVGDTHTFTVKDPGTSSQERSVTMTAQEITVHPVQNVKILTTSEGERVGYMLFNRHIKTAAQPLIDAGSTFLEGDGIDDLVLDLRYNGGGFLYIAQIITSIIAGSAGKGKNFATLEYNDKKPKGNYTFIEDLPNLDLQRLFVLTSSSTCSASELIINSLRGIDIEVILVGSTTCGKYYGFVSTDNCGTTYSTIQLKVVNNKGVADYDDGFSPTCYVEDNDYDHQIGDSEESLLRTALTYQADDACPSSSPTQVQRTATKSFQEGLLSIDPTPTTYFDLPGLIIDK